MCCKSPKAPPPDPAIAANLAKQSAMADKMFAFAERQYADDKLRQVDTDALNKRVTEQAMGIAAKADTRGDEAYEFYQSKGRPLVEKAFEDASGYDSQGNIDAARGRAAADVQQGFDNAAEQSQRALTRMGVNPSSGRFMALQQRLAGEKAAALAGASTNAEEARRGGAIQLRQQASNLASGMPAQALAQGGQALGAGSSAAGVNAGGAQMNMAIGQQFQAGQGAAAGTYGSAAGGYNSLYGNQLQATKMNQDASAANAGGFGKLLGLGLSAFGPAIPLADGGPVSGPGTGTSDSVPAVNQDTGRAFRLSNGEWVVPADVVRAKGEEFFQKLTDQHHNLRRK